MNNQVSVVSKRLALMNVVGLSQSILDRGMPRLNAWIQSNAAQVKSFTPEFPAVTCSAQSSMLTGQGVNEHGIVANGWYDREAAEVKFWKQSNHLVKGEKIWDKLKAESPEFTCAKLFWWYNMYSTADITITPRPLYPADGRKVFDIHTHPMTLREEIKADLGAFPFMSFWGPRAGIPSSQWIADSARWVESKYQPDLSLVYLPHLDYDLQRFGSDKNKTAACIAEIDDVLMNLIEDLEQQGVEPVIVSEYGISEVTTPVHLNRIFREQGWLQIKDELGLETLDLGMSEVFAVADHQIAHVYLKSENHKAKVLGLLKETQGVAGVQLREELYEPGSVAYERSGDIIVTAEPQAWFTYYYWLDDKLAPDYARCIDIHRKIGYDPTELFIDPNLKGAKLKIIKFLLKKKLGFRALLDVIGLDATIIKGSHGLSSVVESEQPIIISKQLELLTRVEQAKDVFGFIESYFKAK